MDFRNPIINSDSYKVSHYRQLPPGTEVIYSYWESRGGQFNETTVFGVQYFIREFLSNKITQEDVDYAAERFALHFGDETLFNRAGWERIVNVHNGYLPVLIKSVPEGMSVPTRNVLMTVMNTDPELPWVTNYLETVLSQLWYPTTVATNSREIKKVIKRFLDMTGDPDGLPFKLHDFGFRGVSSVETAAIGGGAHLVNFMGTDTMIAFEFLKEYYDADMAGFSIPAAEHSTITSWGRENEVEAYRNMINQFGSTPTGMFAVVSDSYDIYNACSNLWGEELIDEVRSAPNMLIVRPDSGDPVVVVNEVLERLGEKFGYETNIKGYKVLNDVRIIQGDGIDLRMVRLILTEMERRGWSADNIAFGSGGGLLQKFDRDTCRFAFKTSAVKINGEWQDVWKDPVTSTGKKSKKGRLKLVRDSFEGFKTVDISEPGEDILQVVYDNGQVKNRTTLTQIRERAKI